MTRKLSVPPEEQRRMGRTSERRLNAEIMAGLARIDREAARMDRKRQQRHERRVANGTAAKPRSTCTCAAYPWPHRPGGGLCRYPDPPHQTWEGQAGRHPGTFGRVSGGSSSMRRRLLSRYGFHPVRDRDRIRRWLPKLYAAWSRREGWPWVYMAMRGWIPAMRVTENGVPPGIKPYNELDLLEIVLKGTSRKWSAHTESPARRRAREKRQGTRQ